MRLSGNAVHRAAWAVVRAAALLVPQPRREEWLRTWRGELWHALHAEAGKGNEGGVGTGVGLLVRSLGAFSHALHERREEGTMAGWIEDARFGMRVLTRRKGWTTLVAATLAVATGATTAMFAVVDGVLLRPLPFPRPDRLVAVQATFESERGPVVRDRVSLPAYAQFLESEAVVTPLAAYLSSRMVVDLGGGAELVSGAWVSANFFETLGLSPILGRAFVPGEDEPGAPLVAVVSQRFWEHRLGGASGLGDATLRLRDAAIPIVGVVPDAATLPAVTTDVWLPNSRFPRSAGFHSHRLVGRLRDGLTLEGAQAGLGAATGEIPVSPGVMGELHLRGSRLRDTLVGSSRFTLLALAGATLLLLAIAGVNLGNLFHVRAGERVGELAVRAALGASRVRLRRQFAIEALLLASVGVVPGILLAEALVRATLALAGDTLPRSWEVGLDPRVAAFAVAVAAATSVLASLAASRPRGETGASLRDAGARGYGGTHGRRLRDALVVLQVGGAGLLLVAGGLLLRSYEGLTSRDPGLDLSTLTATPSLPSRYDDVETRNVFLVELATELEALPEIEAASFADAAPLGGHSNVPLEVEGQVPTDPNQEADRVQVGPGYLESLDASLLAGRTLTSADRADAVPVAVVNATFARVFLPGGAVGRRIRQGPDDPVWRTVVGVVADIRQQGPFVDVAPHVYLPMLQSRETGPVALLVRPVPGAGPVDELVRRTIRAADRAIPVASMETVGQRFAAELSAPRLHLALMGVFAAAALNLALIGVFGVVSHRVRRRRREMAIRLALGAEGGALVRGAVGGGLMLGTVGVALGVGGAVSASGVLERFLFGISPRDPLTFAGIAILLLVTTALASWLPARRAIHVDPSETLRAE